VTITNSEQVGVGTFIEIWMEDETVLVLLLGITRHVSNPRCKSVLGYYVRLVVNGLLRFTLRNFVD
jgi:hypothetical protein